ncbi:hypothetical protein [Streptomyces sp. NBC_00448]|uniref:hypothetical protein n=1 Tax=Streptomyces sp. NBC_00448 TaxID=2903652 RepID=UPI002E1BDB84
MPEKRDEAVEGDGGSSTGLDSLCVLDAVICVHFVGANLQRLLVDVLRAAQLVLLVPEEVHQEVLGKARKYGSIETPWRRLVASDCVRVLPALRAATASPRVVEVFEEIRGLQFEKALRRPKDLGEAVVIAHAVEFVERGHEVFVAIDDQEGQATSARYDLTVLTIEQVLQLAILHGKFPTEGELKRAYARLRSYGDGLVDYGRTELPTAFKDWRASRP